MANIRFDDQVVAEIKAAGGRAVASYDSVATAEGARRIAATAIETFGCIDALINNAGDMRMALFEESREEDAERAKNYADSNLCIACVRFCTRNLL